MGNIDPKSQRRRPTNVSLPADAVAEAKALGINVSRACEDGLRAELNRERAQRFREEHREAIQAHNRWVEENGLPLADLRMF